MGRPFIPVPGAARLDVGNVLNGLYYEHVFYFWQFGAVWGDFELAELSSAVVTFYINRILPLLSKDVYFIKSDASNMVDEHAPHIILPYSGYMGGYDSPSLPNHQSIYFTMAPARRRHDPYFHLVQSGIPQAVVTGNYADKVWVQELSDTWVEMLDIITPFSSDWVVISFEKNGQWRDEPLVKLFSNFYKHDGRISPRSHRSRNLIR